MQSSPASPPAGIPEYVPHPIVPTMTDAEYYSAIHRALVWRNRMGDPLEGRAWGVIARLMQWDRPFGGAPSYYIDIQGSVLIHAVTPDAIMADATYPYHIQLGRLTRRQRKRMA